jgi:quercetin dioxygenase-like cupin family protein
MEKNMKLMIVPGLAFFLLASAASHTEGGGANSGSEPPQGGKARQAQTIARAGTQPSTKGPADYFTGNVRVDPLFAAKDSAPYSGGAVTFEPGARSAWHTHPTGQHLIVTSGVGWTQQWGGPVVEIREGDVVWCPPGVKHWHGAAPKTAMTHIALTGTLNGKNVEWMEKVSDEQYRK